MTTHYGPSADQGVLILRFLRYYPYLSEDTDSFQDARARGSPDHHPRADGRGTVD